MDYITKLQELEDNKSILKDRLAQVSRELSEVHADITGLYHIMEDCKLDAVDFTKIAYKLKEALIKRRNLKEEEIVLDNVLVKGVPLSKTLTNKQIREDKYIKESKDLLQSFNF